MLDPSINNGMILHYYYSGESACKPGHVHGPALRDHYLIHYIHSGKGTFETEGRTYSLSGKCGFLITPGVRFYYKADLDNPWHYSWVGFKGEGIDRSLELMGLSRNNPIFHYDADEQLIECFTELNRTKKELSPGIQMRRTGYLFILLSLLLASGQQEVSPQHTGSYNKQDAYMEQALEYMYTHYTRNIKIQDMAQHLNIDRRYLTSIFKQHLGHSPHRMLVQYRLRKACELMTDTSLSISDIARSVGYEDPLQFSKIFSKHLLVSPMKYRSRLGL
ncbi:AraC family transcriptional regulator [Paenibacillus foliorum]|nr:AraC family transcriptional regulator [Paenibacillus foliorum]